MLHLLDRKSKVTTEMIESVTKHEGNFTVTSDEINEGNETKMYQVAFGNEKEICWCTCRDFKRTRLLCKHFFAVISSNEKCFEDLSPLFLLHPFTNLDSDLFGAMDLNVSQDLQSQEINNEFNTDVIPIDSGKSCAIINESTNGMYILNIATIILPIY